MYYFSKKIKCLGCNGNYRGIKERKTKRYYCSTYHNKRSCVRWTLDENWLLELVYNHFEIDLIKSMKVTGDRKKVERPEIDLESLLSRVETVSANPITKEVTIEFKDGTKTFMSGGRQTYWTNEL